VPVWLATPVLFAASVLGLTGLGGMLLDAEWRVALSSALFGPAAAITALLASTVEWRSPRHRWWLGLGYPALVFVAGLVLAGITLPSPLALAIGTPALITLAILIARERHKTIPIA
jgi:hypothetical protein